MISMRALVATKMRHAILLSCTVQFNQKSGLLHYVWANSENKNQFSSRACKPEAKEFSLKTPAGYIAGKVWNEEAPVAVLCLHGHLDNAGTFDRLVPLLPDHLCCVAIDFPGHGWSYHNLPGVNNTFLHYTIPMERVIRHFGWKQVVILAHSMGGGVSLLYAGIRPSLVHSLITIDLVKTIHLETEELPTTTEKYLENLFDTEHKLFNLDRPTYPYEELIKRAMKNHSGSLDRKEMEILMKRGAKLKPNGQYAFTYSLNVLFPRQMGLNYDQVMAYAARMRCRLMLLKVRGTRVYEDPKFAEAAIETYRQSSVEFEYHEVPGGHHVHLSEPETVVPYVARFFRPSALPRNNVTEGGGSLVSQGLLRLQAGSC